MKRGLYLVVAALVLLAVMSFLSDFAEAQFYHPDQGDYGNPGDSGLSYEDVEFTSSDGTKLTGWFVPAGSNALGTVIHLHGNAQNMSAHFSYSEWLVGYGFNVFTFDYRGYGRSEGRAKREGVYQDSVAAIRYIKSRRDIDQNKLIVFGQSLGGANAITAVAKNETEGIRAVVIEATFYSYVDVAKDRVFDLLATMFVSDAHSAGPVVGKIAPTPILFIHGTDDAVVRYYHSERLHEAAGPNSQLWTIEGGRHTEAFTAYGSIYRPKLVEYLKTHLESHESQ